MNKLLFVALCCFTLTSCSSSGGGNDADALNPIRDITTIEDFTATIVGKQLVFMDTDGTRNLDAQLVINAEMKVTGFTQGGEIDFDWYWDDMAWCRSGVSGLPDNATTLELECQGIDVDGGIVNFTRERGTGELASSWFFE